VIPTPTFEFKNGTQSIPISVRNLARFLIHQRKAKHLGVRRTYQAMMILAKIGQLPDNQLFSPQCRRQQFESLIHIVREVSKLFAHWLGSNRHRFQFLFDIFHDGGIIYMLLTASEARQRRGFSSRL